MATILETIAQYTKERYIAAEKIRPLSEIKNKAVNKEKKDFAFSRKLSQEGLSFICEVKKASPSKGIISEDFPYIEIAKDYQAANADCISCLTEPKWFLGKNEYLEEIVKEVSIPVLRKDFTISEYQIYEAHLLGASAILLICALLSCEEIKYYLSIANALGIDALVEAHNQYEINMALEAGAKIIGVNNRNLNDFSVDINNSTRYRKMIPENILFVSESGINSHKDIEILIENKTDAVLIGESLMKADDRKQALRRLMYG